MQSAHPTEELEQGRKQQEFYTVVVLPIAVFSWMDENALEASIV